MAVRVVVVRCVEGCGGGGCGGEGCEGFNGGFCGGESYGGEVNLWLELEVWK